MHEEYILYHSTPESNLSTIQMFGLLTDQPRLWESWSVPGYLYFATTPQIAIFWAIAHNRENVIESYDQLSWTPPASEYELEKQKMVEKANDLITEGIVVLEVEIPSKFLENDIGDDLKTNRNIPPDRISVYERINREEFVKMVTTDIDERIHRPRVRPKAIQSNRKWKGKDI